MSLSRSYNKEPLKDHRDIEIDAICLAVTTARLVEKINKNGFRFTIGGPMMDSAMKAGVHIRKACARYASVGKRVNELKEGRNALDSLIFSVEVALCSGFVNDEEKATFDIVYDKVSGQLDSFLSSQIAKLKQTENVRQSPDGYASGEFSE